MALKMGKKNNVIKFTKGEDYKRISQFCECGIVLEHWVDSDGVSFGLCSSCHLGIGDELLATADDDNETRH